MSDKFSITDGELYVPLGNEAELRQRIASLETLLQIARGALADFSLSKDMTLTLVRDKANRIYRDTDPANLQKG